MGSHIAEKSHSLVLARIFAVVDSKVNFSTYFEVKSSTIDIHVRPSTEVGKGPNKSNAIVALLVNLLH